MRVNDAGHLWKSPSGLTGSVDVHYVGMTADGTKVFFTSEEELTAEDHDHSTDLYMWSERVRTGRSATNPHLQGQRQWRSGQRRRLSPRGRRTLSGYSSHEVEVPWTEKCDVVPMTDGFQPKIISPRQPPIQRSPLNPAISTSTLPSNSMVPRGSRGRRTSTTIEAVSFSTLQPLNRS